MTHGDPRGANVIPIPYPLTRNTIEAMRVFERNHPPTLPPVDAKPFGNALRTDTYSLPPFSAARAMELADIMGFPQPTLDQVVQSAVDDWRNCAAAPVANLTIVSALLIVVRRLLRELVPRDKLPPR